MICSTCNNIFSYDALINWLSINETCPLCRSLWDNSDVYVNTREHISKSIIKYNKMNNN